MKYKIRENFCHRAFSLIETIAALAILAFICTSVLVIIDNSMAATANTNLQMQAFEVARENMEKILVANSVEETTEYGYSEKYPDIQWQKTIESFSGPSVASSTQVPGWIRAVCSAKYMDMAGEEQEIELVHWITNLTQGQWDKIAEEKEKQEQLKENDPKPGPKSTPGPEFPDLVLPTLPE